MTRGDLKRYGLYLLRWQLSTPILAGALVLLSRMDKLTATVIANLLGGLIFFWVDMFIFTSKHLSVEWDVRDSVVCADCGREARGYRIIRVGKYDKTGDIKPEFRCEECSRRKTEELRLRGINV
jgi:hypothetical protein